MSNRYNNKWIQQIVDLQHEDGSWGCFHTLSQPTKDQPITTDISIDGLTLVFDHVDVAGENPTFRYAEAGSANNVIVGFNYNQQL